MAFTCGGCDKTQKCPTPLYDDPQSKFHLNYTRSMGSKGTNQFISFST